jgi:hypothetical protein
MHAQAVSNDTQKWTSYPLSDRIASCTATDRCVVFCVAMHLSTSHVHQVNVEIDLKVCLFIIYLFLDVLVLRLYSVGSYFQGFFVYIHHILRLSGFFVKGGFDLEVFVFSDKITRCHRSRYNIVRIMHICLAPDAVIKEMSQNQAEVGNDEKDHDQC